MRHAYGEGWVVWLVDGFAKLTLLVSSLMVRRHHQPPYMMTAI